MDLWNFFNKLCGPAQLYVLLSVISVLTIFLQNYKQPHKYCVGIFKAETECNNLVYFFIKILYIVLWTLVLQLLCKNGYDTISWVLVLLPFIGMFILIGLLMITLLNKNLDKHNKVHPFLQ